MSTILIVDDNQFVRQRLSKLLSGSGYTIVEAEDGEKAVRTYSAHRPDVVLMDIVMPQKDGLQALAEIRQFDPMARVIVLTALNQQAVAVQAVQLGARDFLTKPIVPDRLITALERALV